MSRYLILIICILAVIILYELYNYYTLCKYVGGGSMHKNAKIMMKTEFLKYLQTLHSNYLQTLHNNKCANRKMAWKNELEYTPRQVNKLLKVLESSIEDFDPLNTVKMLIIRQLLGIDSTKWSNEQIIATHHSLLIHLMKTNYRRAWNLVPQTQLRKLTEREFRHVCSEYMVPPLALVRSSLEKKGYSTEAINDWIACPTNCHESAICKLIKTAISMDPSHSKVSTQITKQAAAYEVEIEHFLTKLQIPFLTQTTLVEEQKKQLGRAVATPDFYLPCPLVLTLEHPNGSRTTHEIHWIDVKNYLFVHVPFLEESLREQGERYVQYFGPGAFLFHYGFTNDFNITDVIMITHFALMDTDQQSEKSHAS
jgi:hypothetical protein